MTNSRRDSLICLTTAAASTASGVYFAVHTSWLCLLGFYSAALLLWCASRLNADHQRQLAKHEQARGTAGADAEQLTPCCQFWTASNGEVHGPDCTRTRRSSAA
jgi:hypothetical protein